MKKIPFPIALLSVVIVAAVIGWGLTHIISQSSNSAPKAASNDNPPPRLPRGWSYIVVARTHRLVFRRRPRGHIRVTLRNPTQVGSRLTLLVRKPGSRWIKTYLPMRPNGATAWVARSTVKLLTTSYALSVHLRSHRLVLFRDGRVARRFSIGVGQSVTPTPTGTYFITELLKQPDPKGLYGPYAFGLSAYSGVLQHFGRGGNGQVGIHGTNEPNLVGTDVSHGCIRLRNQDILWLVRRLPLGAPVRITHN